MTPADRIITVLTIAKGMEGLTEVEALDGLNDDAYAGGMVSDLMVPLDLLVLRDLVDDLRSVDDVAAE